MTDLDTIGAVADFLGTDKEILVGGVDLPTGSRLLGIGVSTLRQRAIDGEIGHRRDGHRWIFHWQDLAEYVQRRHHGPRTAHTTGDAEGSATPIRSDADTSIAEQADTLGLT